MSKQSNSLTCAGVPIAGVVPAPPGYFVYPASWHNDKYVVDYDIPQPVLAFVIPSMAVSGDPFPLVPFPVTASMVAYGEGYIMECPTGEIVDYKGRIWPSLQTYCYQTGAGLQTESPNEWDARLAEL